MPWAGKFAGLVVDALDVGFSAADRSDSNITKALDYLGDTDGTMYRLKAGLVVGEKHWVDVSNHLATLLTRPGWVPFHLLPVNEVAVLLRHLLEQQQGFSARLTAYPDIDGVLTRAQLRATIAPLAALFGLSNSIAPKTSEVSDLSPLNPRAGLGDVLERLRLGVMPKMTRPSLCAAIGLTESSWDRLRRGEVPPNAGFNFAKFVALVVPDPTEREACEGALRRAFAGARLVRLLKAEVKVGPDAETFWSDCATEWERVSKVGMEVAARSASLPAMRDLFPLIASDATGHWRYVWRDLVRRGDFGYFDLVCASALALANAPREAYGDLDADEAVLRIMSLLDERPDLAAGPRATLSRPKAREELDAAFAADPGQWLKRLALIRFEVNEGDPQRAVELLTGAELAGLHEYFPMLGEAYQKLERHEEALAAFDVALERSDTVQRVCARAIESCQALNDASRARRYQKILNQLRELG